MSKSLQFSMARLFVLVTLVCVSAWAVTLVVGSSLFSLQGGIAATILGATIGYAVGLAIGKPLQCTFLGAASVMVILAALWKMMYDLSPPQS